MVEKTIKKVTLDLVGLDGNAFALMAQFSRQARRESWTPEEIKEVRDKAMAGNYDNLLCVLQEYCE
mgnify:CR=1 FL=1